MTIVSADTVRTIDVGTHDILMSVYSTVVIKLESIHDEIPEALGFLKTGTCSCVDSLKCARQMNLIRDGLSQIKPQDAVYNLNDLSVKAPWSDKLSPVVTSCANMFTTTDGKDLLYEMVSLLTYSYYKKQAIIVKC